MTAQDASSCGHIPIGKRIRVIDIHAHFPTSTRETTYPPCERRFARPLSKEKLALVEARSLAAMRRRWDAWGFPPPCETPPRSDGEAAQLWAREAAEHGLEKVVFVTGGGNDNLARAIAGHRDRFTGFAHHSPFAPGAADELRRAVKELGFRGYKVLAPLLDRPLGDETAYPVWEVAEDLGIPVLVHFGLTGGGGSIASNMNTNPLVLEDIAKAFPTVDFIVPHFGAGYMQETLRLCWACPNVSVDTSGSNQWMQWMPFEVTLASVLRRFLETVGPERIIFGTDSSFLPRGFIEAYADELYRTLALLSVPRDAVEKIFAGNAARLLGLAGGCPGHVSKQLCENRPRRNAT
ncbi:MAG: amidohydrolase family protein [Bacillota bacterium]